MWQTCLWLALVTSLLLGPARAEEQSAYPVGLKQVEFTDGDRTLTLALFYPAKLADKSAKPTGLPFFINLHFYRDAPLADGNYPLMMFSHGRGSNPLQYAWFAQTLAARGYIVAGLYHYRANTYDATIAYLANKLWQRPRDLSHAIDFLLDDPLWGPHIDADRIGVAGHSQGGFTSLWIGGAKVDAGKYLAFQKGWKNNQQVPANLREALPLDASPALDVHDPRIKAVFAMAPGIIKAFGMDEAGLSAMKIPAYITVGAHDTQAPPEPNAVFAAKHIPGAKLVVIPGLVDHEIFVNECDEEGRDEFPEACIDAPGVNRHAIHQSVGDAALQFFGAALAK